MVLQPDTTPIVQPARRVPLSLRQPLRDELQRMERAGIITKEDGPTDWIMTISSTSTDAAPYRCCDGFLPHVLQQDKPARSDLCSAHLLDTTPAPVTAALPGLLTATASTSSSPLYLSNRRRPQQFSGHGNNATMQPTNLFRFCLFQIVTISSTSTDAAPYRCCDGFLPHVLQRDKPARSDRCSAHLLDTTPAPVTAALPGLLTATASTSSSPLYLSNRRRPQQFSGHGNNATMQPTNLFRFCLFQYVTGKHLVLADMLSRSTTPGGVDNAGATEDVEVHALQLLNGMVTVTTQQKLANETARDCYLQTVVSNLSAGKPIQASTGNLPALASIVCSKLERGFWLQ
ncbi:uncharacterized protein LOC144115955 isoform X2 [Amblyomma americanum]